MTPLPWTAVNNHGFWNIEPEVCAVLAGSDGKEDAAFIVRACNAHDDLLAALRQLAGSMNYVLDSLDGEGKDLPARGEVNKSLHDARIAIKRAEGQS